MINARRAIAFLWIGNLLLAAGILTFAFQILAISKTPMEGGEVHKPRVIVCPPVERLDTSELASLPNPLSPSESHPSSQAVLLIGFDRIMNDAEADTAYLYMVGRQLYVNAYVGEPIRDGTAGREVSELSGWRLKSITSKGAVFSTPSGDKTLNLAQSPALMATATAGPDDVRTVFDAAVELFKDGRVEDACVVFEEALRQGPSSSSVYAFMKRAGVDVIASLMNSKDERMRTIGYRLFELAKPGGERRRLSNA